VRLSCPDSRVGLRATGSDRGPAPFPGNRDEAARSGSNGSEGRSGEVDEEAGRER
jgi:hypothetical protein